MNAVDGDGIDQELTRAVSAAMIAAARAGEQIARMNQAAARERGARAAGDAIEAQRQLDAHTESARAYFEIVTRPEYMAAATDAQIQEAARQAYAWRERLPEAQRAEQVAAGERGARLSTGRDNERAVLLANEATTADRRAVPSEWDVSAQSADPGGVAPPDDTRNGREAVAIAEVAQVHPAREAPAAASCGSGQPPSKGPQRSRTFFERFGRD